MPIVSGPWPFGCFAMARPKWLRSKVQLAMSIDAKLNMLLLYHPILHENHQFNCAMIEGWKWMKMADKIPGSNIASWVSAVDPGEDQLLLQLQNLTSPLPEHTWQLRSGPAKEYRWSSLIMFEIFLMLCLSMFAIWLWVVPEIWWYIKLIIRFTWTYDDLWRTGDSLDSPLFCAEWFPETKRAFSCQCLSA